MVYHYHILAMENKECKIPILLNTFRYLSEKEDESTLHNDHRYQDRILYEPHSIYMTTDEEVIKRQSHNDTNILDKQRTGRLWYDSNLSDNGIQESDAYTLYQSNSYRQTTTKEKH